MKLNGKTALVTGSTSGIGLGIATVLAAAGARVILNGFGNVEQAKAHIACVGSTPGYHGADLSDPQQIDELMEYAAREFGGVDILVNNAGIQYTAKVEDFPPEKWNAILAINLSSVFHTTRLASPCRACWRVAGGGLSMWLRCMA
jgi:3-hydroxybutyrate dehydrogenase